MRRERLGDKLWQSHKRQVQWIKGVYRKMRTSIMLLLNLILLVTFVSYIQLQDSNNEDNRCLTLDRHGNCSCCKSGFRGETCNVRCEHCLSRPGIGKPCTYYCQSGYYGKMCDKPCPEKCAPGIHGPRFCKEKYGLPVCDICILGYYGKLCDKICDTNCLNRSCYYSDGKCLNCSSNAFYGDHCSLPCNQGCVSGTCNRTGHCTHGCKFGFYGERCEFMCGSACKHGKCTSHGYHAYICTEGCQGGFWGIPCLEKCPNHCTECEQESGRCTLCVDNYDQKAETGECVKEVKPAGANGSNLIIIVSVVMIVIIITATITIVIWKKRRHRHRVLAGRNAEEHGLLSEINRQLEQIPLLQRVNQDSRRTKTHLPGGKFDRGIDGRKFTEKFTSPEREAEDEHMLKLINELSHPEERHGEYVSPEILETKIQDAERVFVETNGYKEARKTLQQHGYVTITGEVGEGKTTMALMLGVEYRKQGYSIVMVEDVGCFNYQLLLQATNPCFIILDDVFGLLDFSAEMYHLEKKIHFLESLKQEVFLYKKKFMVAFTLQTLKLKEGLKRIQSETASQFFRDEVRVHLGGLMAPRVKWSIFKKHSTNDTSFLKHDVQKVINCKIGFPLICRLYFAFEQFITTTQNAFNDPLDFLKTYTTALLSKKTRISVACIVMVLCEDKLNLAKLEVDTHDKRFWTIFEDLKTLIFGLTRTDICIAARSLRGTLFSEGDIIGFAHPVIYDACAFALAKQNIALVLKYCNLKFICERVRGSVGRTSGPSSDGNTILISSAYHELFVQRLMQAIEDGHYAYVAKHPSLKLEPVERLFVERILTKVKMNKGKRGNTGINHYVVNILKLSVHAHMYSLYEGILETNVSCPPTTFMNECSICGNVDALNFILRRSGPFVTGLMRFESNLLAVLNRHDKISECLIKHASKATMMTYFGSILKLTAKSGKDRAFMMLLQFSTKFEEDINGLSEDGNNMLHLACEGGSKEIVEHFLPIFDVNSRGQNNMTPIMKAVYKGKKEVFDLLMTKGPDLKLTDKWGDTVLHIASREGPTSIVEHLLPSFDINIPGQHDWTPVMNAANSGNSEVFDLLMEKGADLTLTDTWGDNVVHLASRGGHTTIVEHLLPSFDINIPGENGWTPVMNAIYSGKKEVFDLMVTKGPDFTLTDNYGDTVLHIACQEGNTSIVEHLLPLFDINSRGMNGWTPVMKAAFYGEHEVFDLLMTKGADLKLTDKSGDNILHLASQKGHTTIVEHLLASFDINIPGENGWTPVMNAAVSCKKEVVYLLVTKGADLKLTDKWGDNVLHLASRGGNTTIVEYLLPSFDINIQGQNGWTPVMNAAYSGKNVVFYLMVSKVKDLKLLDKYGNTLLHLACLGGNTSIVEHLLPSFNINSRGQNGWTPVMMAAYSGNKEAFDLMVTKEPDLTLTDNYGNTVLHLACRGGNTSIVEHLLPSFDINSRGQNGQTPVMIAQDSGRKEVFDLLVRKGALTS